MALELPGDESHELAVEDEEANYEEDGDGKRDSPYVERVNLVWHLSCCEKLLGEGNASAEIGEWEES